MQPAGGKQSARAFHGLALYVESEHFPFLSHKRSKKGCVVSSSCGGVDDEIAAVYEFAYGLVDQRQSVHIHLTPMITHLYAVCTEGGGFAADCAPGARRLLHCQHAEVLEKYFHADEYQQQPARGRRSVLESAADFGADKYSEDGKDEGHRSDYA